MANRVMGASRLMTRKSVKIREITYEALVNEQEPHESMDDTVQRLVGLAPDPYDLEGGVAAYLDKQQREEVVTIADYIESCGDLTRRVEENRDTGHELLVFAAEATGVSIVQLVFGEDSYNVQYRRANEDMVAVEGFGWTDDEVLAPNGELLDDRKQALDRRVSGAIRRFGTRSGES